MENKIDKEISTTLIKEILEESLFLYTDNEMLPKNELHFIPISCTIGDNPKITSINRSEFMTMCKDYITDWEKALCGLSSHRTFYSQCNGSEWYCGFAAIKTNYDNKATLEDISSGGTEFEAVIRAMNWVIKNIKNREPNNG